MPEFLGYMNIYKTFNMYIFKIFFKYCVLFSC